MRTLALGIIGCASIVRRAVFQPLPFVEGIKVVGIANRTRSRAEALAAEFGVPRVFEQLEDVLASRDVDAVYIALSNDLHTEWVLRAVEAGKHVLVEKPIAMNAAECAKLEERLAGRLAVVLEGLMIQHHPWQSALRELIQEQRYGRLLQMRTELHIPMRDLPLTSYRCDPSRGGGVFADLGCYWLQMLQQLPGFEAAKPSKLKAESAFDGPRGCDWTFDASLAYASGVVAELSASFERPYRTRHVLRLEHAALVVNDFFRANVGRYKITIKIEEPGTGRSLGSISFDPLHYYENQLRYFRDSVLAGQGNRELLHESLERVRLQERIQAAAVYRKRHSEDRMK
ncbi:Predicted dehydrogenase [Paenibacillus algorifonticola]|uniref:Predicted dehydrogenase n=1 Tax=Paenibacillus algorifonticola TaxID=684063 RepID=A0A1I2ID83_9BACL|nr:Gfo/Idh/MocA family oxidoreductase [Paenibacillus algorifonticola]SFF39613.1 Predicted dehydrogenase [Paenibacillus algorifonticola]